MEKNVKPIVFDINSELKILWNKKAYESLLMIFPLIKSIYDENIKWEFKNIKFPKDIYKVSLDEDSENNLAEAKQELLREIQNIIEIAFEKTINNKLD